MTDGDSSSAEAGQTLQINLFLDGFQAGFMSALASVGAPQDFAVSNANACMEAMIADPLILERVREQVAHRVAGLEPDSEGVEMMTVRKYDREDGQDGGSQ